MSDKIRPDHRQRAAYVYVRQSTVTQVREHGESRRRQYALAERARELGFARVEVVDDDLGISGSGAQRRPGFGRLLAAVCEGEVGAVFALEASRLARNSRDWHHLIDLCALTETLVIDADGTYDPKSLNDRLLLGLKGTMSEFELGLLRQRALEALRQMVARGIVLTELPVGYVRTRDNRCEMTPDLQVQEAIRGVFRKFRELGSARQVLLWYRQERLPLPSVRAASRGEEVVWRLPGYHSILSILKSPLYSGAFVWGRRTTRVQMVEGRGRRSRGHEVPLAEWQVLLREHHPGYICWDEYLHNQEQLAANSAMRGQMQGGAPRSGQALLAGLLRCARCGRKLHVSYSGASGRIARYHCRGGQINHGTEWCISFAARRVDEAVAEVLLEALRPVGVEAALEAWQTGARAGSETHRALELAFEKARYETDRARRQYDVVEPENRLVAAELERRWNAALRQQAELEHRLGQAQAEVQDLTEEERQRLLALGQDLDTAWNHPHALTALKKRIVRTIIEEIVADISEQAPAAVHLVIHWAGGTHTPLLVPKNRTGQHRRATDRKVVELVGELAHVCDDRAIASILNRLGYRTGAGNTWTESRIRTLRSQHSMVSFDRSARERWLTADAAAQALGISEASVRSLLRAGILPGKQVVTYAPWVIERESLDLVEVRAAVQAIRSGRRLPPRVDQQGEIPFKSTM